MADLRSRCEAPSIDVVREAVREGAGCHLTCDRLRQIGRHLVSISCRVVSRFAQAHGPTECDHLQMNSEGDTLQLRTSLRFFGGALAPDA